MFETINASSIILIPLSYFPAIKQRNQCHASSRSEDIKQSAPQTEHFVSVLLFPNTIKHLATDQLLAAEFTHRCFVVDTMSFQCFVIVHTTLCDNESGFIITTTQV